VGIEKMLEKCKGSRIHFILMWDKIFGDKLGI